MSVRFFRKQPRGVVKMGHVPAPLINAIEDQNDITTEADIDITTEADVILETE